MRAIRTGMVRVAHGAVSLPLRAIRRPESGERICMHWTEAAFDDYLRLRNRNGHGDLRAMRCPSKTGLVSIVLPVHNGGNLTSEAIESILAQRYPHWELIAIDDGSTDQTHRILKEFKTRGDSRIRILTQPHEGLPAALNHGFRHARGEYLTWISADNRLRPEYLERMVAAMEQSSCEMLYAPYDTIDGMGKPECGSEWCRAYQTPPGSEHIRPPRDLLFYNTDDNNFIGPAFMYRDRVRWLVGDYSPHRATLEDYDYFMRVNESLTVRRAPSAKAHYEYRLHKDSLSAQLDPDRMKQRGAELLVFDDFRRDFLFAPIAWWIDEASGEESEQWRKRFVRKARAEMHPILEREGIDSTALPPLWFPSAFVRFTDANDRFAPPVDPLPPGTLKILILTGAEGVSGMTPPETPDGWDLCVRTDPDAIAETPDGDRPGVLVIPDENILWTALGLRIRYDNIRRIEEAIPAASDSPVKVSVILCTYRRPESLARSLEAVARQDFPANDYEVIVVNNAPDMDLSDILNPIREKYFAGREDRLRRIDCPVRGISVARNVGLGAARGEVIVALDDDAVAEPDLLRAIVEAFDRDASVGVVGGCIHLRVPDSAPEWFEPAARKYWSHQEVEGDDPFEIEAWQQWPWGCNWSARREMLLRIGGFRSRYGRLRHGHGWGEELAAASSARRLGYKVVLQPAARVVHEIDPERLTWSHMRKTILGGWETNFRLEREGYLPRQTSITTIVRIGWRHLWRALSPRRMSRCERMENFWSSVASARQAGQYVASQLRRYRRPQTWR